MMAVRCCRYLRVFGMGDLNSRVGDMQSRIDDIVRRLDAEHDKDEGQRDAKRIEYYTDRLRKLEAELKIMQDGSGNCYCLRSPSWGRSADAPGCPLFGPKQNQLTQLVFASFRVAYSMQMLDTCVFLIVIMLRCTSCLGPLVILLGSSLH